MFADRYKSILVDEEAYLFQLVRYVHNNPVRAGVVADPADSVWTGHREYLGRESCKAVREIDKIEPLWDAIISRLQ